MDTVWTPYRQTKQKQKGDKMSRKFLRLFVGGDLHCGHEIGLTHPDFNPVYKDRESRNYYLSRDRAILWKFFEGEVEKLKPFDVAIWNGDLNDGKGDKSGATELITADRNEQVDMAVAVIETVGAEENYGSFGTPYHSGLKEDWERAVADKAKFVKIGGHDYVDVNGVTFDYRHFVSRSSIPHGRYTPLAKERLWSTLWNEHNEYPKCEVLVRSHVHYFATCGGYGWKAYITPALQGAGTKFGVRRAVGTVDFGFLAFDCYGKGEYVCHERILKLKKAKKHLLIACKEKRAS